MPPLTLKNGEQFYPEVSFGESSPDEQALPSNAQEVISDGTRVCHIEVTKVSPEGLDESGELHYPIHIEAIEEGQDPPGVAFSFSSQVTPEMAITLGFELPKEYPSFREQLVGQRMDITLQAHTQRIVHIHIFPKEHSALQ